MCLDTNPSLSLYTSKKQAFCQPQIVLYTVCMNKPRNANTKLFFTVFIIILVLVAGFFFLYSKKGEKSASGVATTTPKILVAPVLTAEDLLSWKIYNDTQARVSFKYPDNWPAPIKTNFGTRYLFDFKNGLIVESGQFYNEKASKLLTIADMVDRLVLSDGAVSKVVRLGGKSVTKVSYSSTKFFMQNKSATDLIVVTNKNNVISSEIVNAIVGTFEKR